MQKKKNSQKIVASCSSRIGVDSLDDDKERFIKQRVTTGEVADSNNVVLSSKVTGFNTRSSHLPNVEIVMK